jgi:hypothetical protein
MGIFEFFLRIFDNIIWALSSGSMSEIAMAIANIFQLLADNGPLWQ